MSCYSKKISNGGLIWLNIFFITIFRTSIGLFGLALHMAKKGVVQPRSVACCVTATPHSRHKLQKLHDCLNLDIIRTVASLPWRPQVSWYVISFVITLCLVLLIELVFGPINLSELNTLNVAIEERLVSYTNILFRVCF
jgi:hypothetical protein